MPRNKRGDCIYSYASVGYRKGLAVSTASRPARNCDSFMAEARQGGGGRKIPGRGFRRHMTVYAKPQIVCCIKRRKMLVLFMLGVSDCCCCSSSRSRNGELQGYEKGGSGQKRKERDIHTCTQTYLVKKIGPLGQWMIHFFPKSAAMATKNRTFQAFHRSSEISPIKGK